MRQNGHEPLATFWHRDGLPARVLVGFALAALWLAGCGAEAYEQRLKNTGLLFAHIDLVNQNLQGAWGDPETGVSLRAPLQFAVLPPPAKTEADPAAEKKKPAKDAAKPEANADSGAEPAAKEEGAEEEEEVVPDDRQPTYINIGLPGLRGAFKATVKLINDKDSKAEGEAFLYVLTNHDLAEQPEQAKEFEQEFIKMLTEALHVSVEPEDWGKGRFPPGDPATNGFVRPLDYKIVTVTSAEEIAGYTRTFSAYMYELGDIQVIVLFVLPADTDTSENFARRVPLCLETLGVTGRLAPPVKGGIPAGTAAPSAF